MIQHVDNPEETQEDVNGTVIGFFTLNYSMVLVLVVSIFISPTMIVISADILDFEVDDVKVEIQNFETFEQHFPIDNKTFTNTEIDYADIDAEIREAE